MATAETSLKQKCSNVFGAHPVDNKTLRNINLTIDFPPRLRRTKFVFKVSILLFLIAAIGCSILFYRNYQTALATVDARLKNGYLISQPGIYAAPQVLRVNRALDAEELITLLKRAGYAENETSDLWNGGFHRIDQHTIEVAPRRYNQNNVEKVEIAFDERRNRIAQITGDNQTLNSFALEPEFLTGDARTKTASRTILRYEDLPANLINAITAIEDRHFFEHHGFDLSGIARAAWKNASLGQAAHGGSTVTQQLVKNTYLSSDRTFTRKYNELLLSIALEQRLTKSEILALYCNEIYLGQRGEFVVRGVAQAAHTYFAKDLKDLSLAESALLAGMIKSPTKFSPAEQIKKSIERRNLVLAAMVGTNKITQDEAANALKEEINLSPINANELAIAPHYLDFVRRFVRDELPANGTSKQNGAIVHTTIDLEMQRAGQEILDAHLNKLAPLYRKKNIEPQGALVALDPHTGNVLALVGGSNYAGSQLNRAVDARRQPGSTFKPFVAATALENGISPLQRFTDAPHEFELAGGAKYRPQNYAKYYSNQPVTLRTALVKSLNTVTVELALQTGIEHITQKAADFGLPATDKTYPSLALGTLEASPLELAAAYAVFANGGAAVKPRVIVPPNEMISETIAKKQVIKPQTAFMMTDMLTDVITSGTARSANASFKNVAVAGKTGTTERDGWFVGYTPNLVVAVWVGFDAGAELKLTGAESALPIWTEFVSKTVDTRPEFGGKTFPIPTGIVFADVDPATGQLANTNCPTRIKVALSTTFAQGGECYEHRLQPDFAVAAFVASNAAVSPNDIDAEQVIDKLQTDNVAIAAAVAAESAPIVSAANLQQQINQIQFADKRFKRRRADQSQTNETH